MKANKANKHQQMTSLQTSQKLTMTKHSFTGKKEPTRKSAEIIEATRKSIPQKFHLEFLDFMRAPSLYILLHPLHDDYYSMIPPPPDTSSHQLTLTHFSHCFQVWNISNTDLNLTAQIEKKLPDGDLL